MKLKYRSKEKEQEFLDHIKGIFEDPFILVPDCLHKGVFCPFVQYQKKLEQLVNTGKFDKYAGSADQFLSAVSETYKVLESKSAPVLGVISTPFGSVEYAKRGNTDPIVLAGVQNYKNKTWRMLAFSTLAKSKGVRVFSTKQRFIGSCKDEAPDISFFSEALDEHSISHTTDGIIEIGSGSRYFDLIFLGQIRFRVHEDVKQNLTPILMRHILIQDPPKDFQFQCDFLSEISSEIPKELSDSYLSGRLDNKDLIRNLIEHRKKIAVNGGKFVLGDEVYNNIEDFLSQFSDPTFDPSKLLPLLKDRNEGVMLDNASFRKLLEILWHNAKDEIIQIYFPDFDREKSKVPSGDPLQQLYSLSERLAESEREQSITAEAWSQDSAYLIDLIKAHVKKGKIEGIRFGEKGTLNRTKKAIFYSYLLSLNESKNREWKFTQEEKELGQKLLQFMDRIINGESPEYDTEINKMKVYVV